VVAAVAIIIPQDLVDNLEVQVAVKMHKELVAEDQETLPLLVVHLIPFKDLMVAKVVALQLQEAAVEVVLLLSLVMEQRQQEEQAVQDSLQL
jgi:hypothetical protein